MKVEVPLSAGAAQPIKPARCVAADRGAARAPALLVPHWILRPVHAEAVASADDRARLERRARYFTRAPMRLDAIEMLDENVLGVRTSPDPRTGETERDLEILDWVHAVNSQLPDPQSYAVRYSGA